MSWRTSKLFVRLRQFGRSTGLNSRLAKLVFGRDYEGKFDSALASYLKEGVCVWDIGANRGYYTASFAQAVGPSGSVYAFEPSPTNFLALEEACEGYPKVKCLQVGLGKEDGEFHFRQEGGKGTTSRVMETASDATETVQIRTGESVLREYGVELPDVLKIDVEGLELDVLRGCSAALKSDRLAVVGVEVHFRLLKERGQEHGPREIEQLLRGCGLVVTWPDPSHIIAYRN